MLDTIFNFVLVTALSIGFLAGFFLIVGLIFNPKSTREFLSEYFEWVKAIPGGILFFFGWGIFWMIPIMIGLIILNLLFVRSIFVNLGVIGSIFLFSLAILGLYFWYMLGWVKLTSKDKKDEDESA